MKNRTLTGIICIVIAIAITFGLTPLINSMTEKKETVVVFNKTVGQGNKIAKDDIVVSKLPKSALPDKYLKDSSEVIDKYAASTIYKGDIATSQKLQKDSSSPDALLLTLNKNRLAISITLPSFASGLSGKIQSGDIVSICVNEKNGNVSIPNELKYLQVLTTTTSGGIDESEVIENEDGSFELPSTISFIVNPTQAALLSSYEKNSRVHIALVYRGSEKGAQKYLNAQEKYFNQVKGE